MSRRDTTPRTYERGGKTVVCPHCGGDTFWLREGLLCTKTTSFFSAEALNPGTDCLICTSCRRIEWFLGERERP